MDIQDDSDEYTTDFEDYKKSEQKKGNRRKRWKTGMWKSYVQQLCEDNPEFKENHDSLVQALVAVMHSIKAPSLPDNFCIASWDSFM